MQEIEKKKRRPKGPSALGDVLLTKAVVDIILKQQGEDAQAKTARLRELRLSTAQQSPEVAGDDNHR